jgi:uncharacterized membrane protein
MGWLFASMLGFVVLIAVVLVVFLVRRSARPERPTESDAEDYLAEYFALEEFNNDADLRERLEHLRGVPELR